MGFVVGLGVLAAVKDALHVVLTGDLVGSTGLPLSRREAAMARVTELLDCFEEAHPGATVGKLEFFRGDSWQCCLAAPSLAITAAVFFRAGLKAVGQSTRELDTRIGIGIGPVEKIDRKRISLSTGEAFICSGAALDGILKRRRMDIRLGHAFNGTANIQWLSTVALPLLDLHVSQWTERESVAVFGDLMGWTQQETADNPLAALDDGSQPTQQAINNAVTRIQWNDVLWPALQNVERQIGAAHEPTTPSNSTTF